MAPYYTNLSGLVELKTDVVRTTYWFFLKANVECASIKYKVPLRRKGDARGGCFFCILHPRAFARILTADRASSYICNVIDPGVVSEIRKVCICDTTAVRTAQIKYGDVMLL